MERELTQEEKDFQRPFNLMGQEVFKHKPNTQHWIRLKDYYFDLHEVYALNLDHNKLNGEIRVKVHLKSGIIIELDHFAARRFWEGFTGETLPYYD